MRHRSTRNCVRGRDSVVAAGRFSAPPPPPPPPRTEGIAVPITSSHTAQSRHRRTAALRAATFVRALPAASRNDRPAAERPNDVVAAVGGEPPNGETVV